MASCCCCASTSRARENTELLASSVVMHNIGKTPFAQVLNSLPDVMSLAHANVAALDWSSTDMYRVLTFLRYYTNMRDGDVAEREVRGVRGSVQLVFSG
ncbi:unnamed protein product [Sphagnum balticum]